LASVLTCQYSSPSLILLVFISFFFFNDPATTEIYTLSLHDALPILFHRIVADAAAAAHEQHADRTELGHRLPVMAGARAEPQRLDRKSTRLNSSHRTISYAVFCLKKKKKKKKKINQNKKTTTIH